MRNLKRALSLALALVMVLSMMVVGAGAVSIDDFTDADEIVNTEAVTTMVSLGVIDGNDDGSYNPTGVVKRGEMAKLIAVMLNGGKEPTLGETPVVFADTAGHWAQNYISYVANLHIIDGRGDGTFGPNDDVTGSEAAKMILTALGYRSEIEGFTGANWAINVQLKANDIDLFDGLTINPDQGLSRDNTAQMLYNAVQAQEVEYRNLDNNYDNVIYPTNMGTVLENRFGVVKVEGVVVANDIMAIDGNGTTVSGKARLSDIYVGGTHRVETVNDVTRLISDTYPVALDNSYLGQRVVLYVKGLRNLAPNAASTEVIGTPILSDDNTVATTADRLKDTDAVRSFLSDNSLSLPASGVDADAVHGTVYYTKNETLINEASDGTAIDVTRSFAVTEASNVNGTELTFIDHDGDGVVDYIFKTLPHMAKVTVYNETDEELTIAGEGTIDFDDIADPDAVAKDDIVLYYLMNETYYLSVAETISGEVESYNNNDKSVTVDGTAYGASTVDVELASTDLEKFGAEDNMPMVGNTYTFYLDNHGNAVAWILGEETLGNYALVLASDDSGSAVVDGGQIKLLLADGSVVTGDVNLLASANKFNLGGTSGEKEAAMAGKLRDNGMQNTLVTYVIGSNGAVTIGEPTDVNNYYSVSGAEITETDGVSRGNARYTIRYDDGTGARALVDDAVSVNDNTLFFIRNITGNGNTYSVVKGISNLPTTPLMIDEDTEGTIEQIVYSDTNANPNVARAVLVDANYKGAANYVYLTNSFTGTVDINGQEVYTYPVVFEDGTEGTLNVDSRNMVKELVYQYTVNSDGVATLETTEDTYNGYVTTYGRASNLSVVPGTNGDATIESWYVPSDANIWNVEGKPYEEELTRDMSVAFVLDSDGNVQTVFVKDANVTLGTAKSDVSGVSVKSDLVYSGYNALFGNFRANADIVYSYTVLLDNGRTETHNNVRGTTSANGYLEIEMPENADTLTLTYTNLDGQGSGTQEGNVDTGFADSTANATYTVATNGVLNVTLDYTAPAHVYDSATVSFNVDVYADGVYYDTLPAVASEQLTNGAFTGLRLRDTGYPTDQELTFKIVDEKFSDVEVHYVDGNGDPIEDQLAAGYDDHVSTNSLEQVDFYFANYANMSGDATITLSGYANVNNGGWTNGDTLTTSIHNGWFANIQGANDKAVTVKIVLDEGVTTTYEITAAPEIANLFTTGVAMSNWVEDASIDKLALLVSKTTGIDHGENITIKAMLDNTAQDNYGYVVSVTVNGEKKTSDATTLLNSNTAVDIGTWAITANDEITVSDIEITAIPKLAVIDTTWSDYQVTFTYNRPLDESITIAKTNVAIVDTDGSGAPAVVSVEVTGNQVIVNLGTNVLTATDTVTINAAVKDKDYNTGTANEIASGTTVYTVAEADKVTE